MTSPVPPTWKTTGSSASSACAHTRSSATWLGECVGGQPDATSSAAAPAAGRDEAAGRGEVLAVHDLVGLDGAVIRGRVTRRKPLEGRPQVTQLLLGITRLAQLVAAGERERLDAVAQRRIGVVAQPRR